jgi:hypothetical protein
MSKPEHVDNTVTLFLREPDYDRLNNGLLNALGITLEEWGMTYPDQLVKILLPDPAHPATSERIIHRKHHADGPQTLDPAEIGQEAVDREVADIDPNIFDPDTATFGVRLFIIPNTMDAHEHSTDEILAASRLLLETVVTPPNLAF